MDQPHLLQGHIAYFSMEIAVHPQVPTYSGGLGVLAGDLMRSAADLGLPVVGVTLASRAGYFAQRIVDGRQVEQPDHWDPERFARRLPQTVQVGIGDRQVKVGAWEYELRSCAGGGGTATVLLLDTDLPDNAAQDRQITHFLYGGDDAYRLRQEIVLGVAGVRMLEALGIAVQKYHLNEGHAAFLTLELLRRQMSAPAKDGFEQAVAAVQSRCVFTTHTPVPAGHDQFELRLVMDCLGGLVDEAVLRSLAGAPKLNMTRLALKLSGWVNGVAKRHAQTSRALFPGHEVHAISNGVHPATWAAPSFQALFDRHIPYWCQEPESLLQADRIPLEEIVAAHAQAKAALIAHALQACPACGLAPERFTIGFARRMTRYKRPDLLFSDVDRLLRIAQHDPLQIVLAGKAHPHDQEGKDDIEKLHAWAREFAGRIPMVFLPNYGMETARLVVAGVDLWLNTPQRPLEASGTSGMKAALNGVPSLSILDGWWLEGCAEGETGWAIGDDGPHDNAADAAALYAKLEGTVLPLFHRDRDGWAHVMRRAIARNASYFNSHRMLRRYALEAYAR